MPIQGERCVIVKVMNEHGDIAYVEEEDVDGLPMNFTVIAKAVSFFIPVAAGEN